MQVPMAHQVPGLLCGGALVQFEANPCDEANSRPKCAGFAHVAGRTSGILLKAINASQKVTKIT